MNHIAALLLALVLGLSFADMPTAAAALAEGDYERARDLYFAVYDANGSYEALYKLAEATTLAAQQYSDNEALIRYELAENYAREAIALDPQRSEGYMELARALGRLALYKGVFEAMGLASEVKDSLDKVLELEPNHASAMHALAMWHLEVPWIAGGRTNNVIPLFEQAIALEPENISHYSDFADALLRLEQSERAKTVLETALALEPRHYADQTAHTKAQSLLDANF